MHIAEYFPLLVHVGDPVYVFGGQPAQILSSNADLTPARPATAPAPAPDQKPGSANGIVGSIATGHRRPRPGASMPRRAARPS